MSAYDEQRCCPECGTAFKIIRLSIFNHGPRVNVFIAKIRECWKCGYMGAGKIIGGYHE